MPDHIHLLLWPSTAADVTALMRDFKTFTAKRIIRQAEAEGRNRGAVSTRYGTRRAPMLRMGQSRTPSLRCTHKYARIEPWGEKVGYGC